MCALAVSSFYRFGFLYVVCILPLLFSGACKEEKKENKPEKVSERIPRDPASVPKRPIIVSIEARDYYAVEPSKRKGESKRAVFEVSSDRPVDKKLRVYFAFTSDETRNGRDYDKLKNSVVIKKGRQKAYIVINPKYDGKKKGNKELPQNEGAEELQLTLIADKKNKDAYQVSSSAHDGRHSDYIDILDPGTE